MLYDVIYGWKGIFIHFYQYNGKKIIIDNIV